MPDECVFDLLHSELVNYVLEQNEAKAKENVSHSNLSVYHKKKQSFSPSDRGLVEPGIHGFFHGIPNNRAVRLLINLSFHLL